MMFYRQKTLLCSPCSAANVAWVKILGLKGTSLTVSVLFFHLSLLYSHKEANNSPPRPLTLSKVKWPVRLSIHLSIRRLWLRSQSIELWASVPLLGRRLQGDDPLPNIAFVVLTWHQISITPLICVTFDKKTPKLFLLNRFCTEAHWIPEDGGRRFWTSRGLLCSLWMGLVRKAFSLRDQIRERRWQ